MQEINRREKFVGLAEKRVSNALDSIRRVGNLSNRSIYEYTDADVSKIILALSTEMSELKRKFSSGGLKDRPTFKL